MKVMRSAKCLLAACGFALAASGAVAAIVPATATTSFNANVENPTGNAALTDFLDGLGFDLNDFTFYKVDEEGPGTSDGPLTLTFNNECKLASDGCSLTSTTAFNFAIFFGGSESVVNYYDPAITGTDFNTTALGLTAGASGNVAGISHVGILVSEDMPAIPLPASALLLLGGIGGLGAFRAARRKA